MRRVRKNRAMDPIVPIPSMGSIPSFLSRRLINSINESFNVPHHILGVNFG